MPRDDKTLPPIEPEASTFVPDGVALDQALRRITHLGIGAHQDDLEIMAYHGIAHCYGDAGRWFGGVTCTDGAGSPRAGEYAGFSDEQMIDVRRREQDEAARVGEYSAMVQLGYPSAFVQGHGTSALEDTLLELLEQARPEVVYTHNLADKHETHVAVGMAAVRALRRLPASSLPERVYGCETWRDLDWMMDGDVVVLDVSPHPELAERLINVFASQVAGGKRYDLATVGRRLSNATYRVFDAVDKIEQAWLAMDLTPLIADSALDVEAYVGSLLEAFCGDVRGRLRRHVGRRADDRG